jgi:hypothetical protein
MACAAARAAPAPRVLLGCALATVLTGCSSTSEPTLLFADPGKYAYHNCEQIAGEIKNWTRRQQELKALLDRADQSAGGAAVGFLAYKTDYVSASEELEVLRTTAHSKNCDQGEAWRSSTAIR